ncbi:glycosyltransferase family 4 protein [uncultured Vagococcus sp.]|uniref:glycosyltransferase family 4 protein n=1 Tax=uncultured Vagococcus sp. TaxID=189676 RepID=UPI0028D83ED7|nr:glycosyltransferase family 4 protein [uncultured Vagococcus sp.]
MDILFLSIAYPKKGNSNLYSDLAIELVNAGHHVTVVTVEEHRDISETSLGVEGEIERLRVRVGNQFGVGLIEKGLTTLKTTPYLKKAIHSFLGERTFDLILYSTPPVTFAGVVKFCKKKFRAKTYLMLKDIFPQNAVDLGMIKKNSIIYKFFKRKEKQLYDYSDQIGCMSKANIEFVEKQFPGLYSDRLELFYNSKKILPFVKSERNLTRSKYNLPQDKIIFVFGGNLGKPQGIDFLIEGINKSKSILEAHFLIIGNGSEVQLLESYLEKSDSTNLSFMGKLPSDEYNQIMKACDVGLIVLSYKFTIPNVPSRILSYMHEQMPIFAATDRHTDISHLILENAQCGWWCESKSPNEFSEKISQIVKQHKEFSNLGKNGRTYLESEYDVKLSVSNIEKFVLGE